MSALGSRWRIPLRIARRQVARNWSRSATVVAMIALPVTAVVAADVIFHSANRAVNESSLLPLASADALLEPTVPVNDIAYYGYGTLNAGYDPTDLSPQDEEALLRSVVGDDAILVPVAEGRAELLRDGSRFTATVVEADPTTPLSTGALDLVEGRWPGDDTEVVVGEAEATAGMGIGYRFGREDGSDLTVVGVASSKLWGDLVLARPGSVLADGAADRQGWWMDRDEPVSWSEAVDLAELGVTGTYRSIFQNPPTPADFPDNVRDISSSDDGAAVVTLLGLITTMIVMEVVLLAGPAFAVSARRSERALALYGSVGATPRAMRRVVLAEGLVLGGVSALVAVALGVAAGHFSLPLLTDLAGIELIATVVKARDLIIIAGFAITSALLAALAPAFSASRRSIISVLTGRRSALAVRHSGTVAGVVLLAAASGLTVLGSGGSGMGFLAVTIGAIVSILGMILMLPAVLAGLGRAARLLPLPLRYAVRDSARNRSRTIPSIAATAATVAGTVALAVAVTSYDAVQERDYRPELAYGVATIYSSSPAGEDWDALATMAEREIPDAEVTRVDSIDTVDAAEVHVAIPDAPEASLPYRSTTVTGIMVDDGSTLDTIGADIGLDDAQQAAATEALADGRAVILVEQPVEATEATLTQSALDYETISPDREMVTRGEETSATVPALYLVVDQPPAEAIITPDQAAQLEAEVIVTDLIITGDGITKQHRDALFDAISTRSSSTAVYLEVGYEPGKLAFWTQVGLGSLSAVLMIGGTLTATLLALADAGADLSTLASVGAAPGVRRWISASYALVIGLTGAALGTVLGFLPGIGATRGMQAPSADAGTVAGRAVETLVVIPWPFLAVLVIGLPLIVAAVAAAATRARLPFGAHLAQLGR